MINLTTTGTKAFVMRFAICTLGLTLLSATACTREFPLEPGLLSFDVTFTDPGHLSGTEQIPLEYVAGAFCSADIDCGVGNVCFAGSCAHKAVIDIQAVGRDGAPWAFYTGDVTLRVTPGELLSSPTIRIEAGVAKSQEIIFWKGRGKTHVWVEDDGYVPHTRQYGQCSDGIDNDNNGLIDMADAGCQEINDDLEAPVGLATGISPTFTFNHPTIYDLQFSEFLQRSPLRGEQVQIRSGTLVVTNVLASGFYMVDLRDNVPDRLNNGMFIFTFSKPDNIEYGDRLCGVSGAVADFVGATQLSFPSYFVYDAANPPAECATFPGFDAEAKVPDPWEITADLADEFAGGSVSDYLAVVYANSLKLEALEGNLVTFSDLEVTTRFIACDANDNGTIDRGTPEFDCRDACQDEALCTDLESYFEFNQYAAITGGKKKVYGSTLLATGFTPLEIGFLGDEDASGRCIRTITDDGFLEYNCAPLQLESVTGSLRQIYLCGEDSDNSRCDLQFWVLDPRFDSDVVVKE